MSPSEDKDYSRASGRIKFRLRHKGVVTDSAGGTVTTRGKRLAITSCDCSRRVKERDIWYVAKKWRQLGVTIRAIANTESKRLGSARAIAVRNVIVSVRDLDKSFGWHHAVAVDSPGATAITQSSSAMG